MIFLIASFRKDLARWRLERNSFLIWLAIPFLIGGLMTLLFGGDSGSGPSGTLLIDDQDDTLTSGFIAGAFAQDQMSALFTVRQVGAEEGREIIEAGEASAFLTIPKGFQNAFVNETAVTLVLRTNPSQTILPGIIEDVTDVFLDAGFYLQATFGDEIREIQNADADVGQSNLFVSALAVQINEKLQSLDTALFPPAFDLELVEPPPAEPRPDIGLLFLPGIVLMAVLFSSQGLSADFWRERGNGTLRRLVASPGKLSRFVLGKALAASVVLAIIAGTTLLAGFLYHGIAWAKLLPSMLWVVVAGMGFFAWFASIQMIFPNERSANLLTTIILFPLMMIGGSFFPLDTLPQWLASIGRVSPNGFVADRLTAELTAAGVWTMDLKSWAIVFAMTVSGLFVCCWRLQSGFARRE